MPAPYVPASVRHFEPRRISSKNAPSWLAFAYDLTQSLRPKVVVDNEAGAAHAMFTCCQSMKDHDIDGIAYAFDDWSAYTGDGAPTYDQVNAHGRQFYLGIAYVARARPELCARQFGDDSVSLAFLGPGSTQDDVRDWLRKTADHGTLVIKGIDRSPALEVWAAISEGERGRSMFALTDLGVIIGSAVREAPLVHLMRTPSNHAALRKLYAHIDEFLRLRTLNGPAAFFGRKKPPARGGHA